MPTAQTPLRTWLGLPLIFAAIFGLFRSAGVPEGPGLVYGTVAGSAIFGIVLLARSRRELAAALAGIAIGIVIGFINEFPCTPIGIAIGPPFGFLLYRLARGPVERNFQPDRANANRTQVGEPVEAES